MPSFLYFRGDSRFFFTRNPASHIKGKISHLQLFKTKFIYLKKYFNDKTKFTYIFLPNLASAMLQQDLECQ